MERRPRAKRKRRIFLLADSLPFYAHVSINIASIINNNWINDEVFLMMLMMFEGVSLRSPMEQWTNDNLRQRKAQNSEVAEMDTDENGLGYLLLSLLAVGRDWSR